MDRSNTEPQTDVIIRVNEVMRRTGLSRTTIWRRINARRFPAAIPLGDPAAGDRTIGWAESEIAEWIRAQKSKRSTG